ncbi:MAG: glutamine-hydrolyzing carbamoyl-phosphate synthase small subunit [Patescibacteria group bacterium]
MKRKSRLILADGTVINGRSFGAPVSTTGEVVFNTGMVGYPESLTDPSYHGQLLVLTYPLIGSYGVPGRTRELGLLKYFESEKIQIAGLIVSEYVASHSHYLARQNLASWLKASRIPALADIDTRSLTQRLRHRGTLPGKIIINREIDYENSDKRNLLPAVSIKQPKVYKRGAVKIVLIDCGTKNNIIRELLRRDVTVIRLPWNFPLSRWRSRYDGVVISNGPGNPVQAAATVEEIANLLVGHKPILGICLGNQLLALAAGAKTYKLKFGHRGQNQPIRQLTDGRCFITSQNHGFAVRSQTLAGGFKPWFINLNDQTIEGIRHHRRPFFGVQFHPEAAPGPTDTGFIFDLFLRKVKGYARR